MRKQATLGYLIERLERIDPEKEVRFDFVYFMPTTFDSYRGYYEQLAIGYSNERGKEAMKVGEFLSMCKSTLGKEFHGWKGGEYTMGHDTPLWVANPGECGSTAIVDVIDTYVAVIATEWHD